jgi:alanine racemase
MEADSRYRPVWAEIDLDAVRANVRTLAGVASPAALMAVVKADGYGHGAADCGAAALAGGATALCVATVPEAVALREELPSARIVVLGPTEERDVTRAREARLELTIAAAEIPESIPVHLKLDTGMGRWGLSELVAPTRDVVGLMTHLATADDDLDFARLQLRRFDEETAPFEHLLRHAANSAAALRLPESRYDAVRCGIALYGISPFGTDPADDGLEPALEWRTELAQVRLLHAGESTGYGRRFVAEHDTWIGIVPVGYADGLRRDLTGAEVLVEGERRRIVGTVSMDAAAVELARPLPAGTPVTLVGDGIRLEEHARVADTIAYELACGIRHDATRMQRVVVET